MSADTSTQHRLGHLPDYPYLVVLGIAQDAGYPQADCRKKCCEVVWNGQQEGKMVSCLALVDPASGRSWLFDATPDFREQLHRLQQHAPNLAGIFLTHAHMGHYTGLIHLGREAMGAKSVPVYAMSRLQQYLHDNGPWSQLVQLNNITIRPLNADSTIQLTKEIAITPFLVPHRDEFSETVGYQINVNNKKAIFIPDIDKWEKWDRDIIDLIKTVNYAYLDGTFFQNGELPGRDMSEIPHPFVEESMQLFNDLPAEDKSKVHFIHFNHTNPLLRDKTAARQMVLNAGFKMAEEGQIVDLN